MQIRECYEAIGGNYDDVRSRLVKDELISRFVIKFLDDDSYELLTNSLQQKEYKEAFRAAHTLKGICQNLGFERLGDSAACLTETLRNSETVQVDEAACELQYKKVSEDYQETVDAISKYKESAY